MCITGILPQTKFIEYIICEKCVYFFFRILQSKDESGILTKNSLRYFMKKRIVSVLMSVILGLVLGGCRNITEPGNNAKTEENVTSQEENEKISLAKKYNATDILLSDEQILVNGKAISNESDSEVYQANDIIFYLEGQDFTYGEGKEKDGHSQEEADSHTVVHITKPGNYVLRGKMSAGQIAVDLGEGAKKDSEAVVTLILNDVNITCSVAPGVIFYNVYECGDNDADNATKEVDTSAAGANIVIADDSINYVNGSYVAKIYESVELNEAGTEIIDSKKLHKYDAAFYSRRTMNITGEDKGNGILNIQAENEGLDSELHLTINGGIININSGNDGINTNEDGVSVTTVNDGILNITVNGSTGEGDGIDSNGWLIINGGIVTASACGFSSDAGIDSDMGIHINGGTVIATGNMLDEIADSEQAYVVFTAMDAIKAGTEITLKNETGDIITGTTIANACTCIVLSTPDLLSGTYTFWENDEQLKVSEMGGGMFGKSGGGKFKPEDGNANPPQLPEGKISEFPEGDMQPPKRPEGEASMRPEGEHPIRPEGEVPRFPGDSLGETEAKKEFVIKEGANKFLVMK